MTNASVKNIFLGFSVLALVLVLSLGAFASVAFADGEEGGFFDDIGGTYFDDSYGSYFDDSYGSYDDDSYGSYYDDSYGNYYDDQYGTYYDDESGNYFDDEYGSYFDDEYGDYFDDEYDYYEEYNEYSYTDSYGQTQSYSTPKMSFPSMPFKVTSPSYAYSQPRSVSYPPTYYPPQQPPHYSPPPAPPITNNTCVNYSCNTNVNNINNSVSGGGYNTATLVPVYTTPPQHLVQYVAPAPILPVPNAYCTITASPAYIQNGQAAFLSWTSTGASNAWLSDGIGAVAPNGTLTVRPNVSTTYTLTISGYGGTRTCTAYVNVSGVYPYVSLSQIPYTGFDLGTFGNAIYWAGILAFALASAYLVLYYRGGATVLAGSLFGNRRIVSTRVQGSSATPAMFSRNTKTSALATSRIENLPVAHTNAPKDSMAFTHGDGAPFIVVNRG